PLRRGLQPHERRAEDDGDHRGPPLQRGSPRRPVLRAVLGRPHLPRRDRARDDVRGVADRADDGDAPHRPPADRRLLRRDLGCDRAARPGDPRHPPVSTTHTITGAIIGVGSIRRLSAVRWGVARNVVWAWILTIPCTGVIAAGIYLAVRVL